MSIAILASGCSNPLQDNTSITDMNSPLLTNLADDLNPTRVKNWSWGCTLSNPAECEYQYQITQNPLPLFTNEPYDATLTASQPTGDGLYYLHIRVRNTTDHALTSETFTYSAILDNTGPSITTLTPPPTAYYGLNANVEFTMLLSEVVIVTGMPRIGLTVGGATRYANYASGSGTNTLIFRYIPQAGDTDNDGVALLVNALDFNGGTVRDAAAIDAITAITPPNLLGVRIDTTAPTVLGLSNDLVPKPSKTWVWGCSELCTYRYFIDTVATTSPVGAFSSTSTATHNTGSGSFYIHVQALDAAGNQSPIVHVFALLNATAPPQINTWLWNISSPANGSTSSDNTPQFTITGANADNGATVQLYTDNTCATAVGSPQTIVTGMAAITDVVLATNGSQDGNRAFHAIATGTVMNSTICYDISRGYFFDTRNPNPPTGVSSPTLWVTSTAVSPTFTWTLPVDPGGINASGIGGIEAGISSTAGGSNDSGGWTALSAAATSYAFPSGLTLAQCTPYYPSLRSIDNAGNVSSLVAAATTFRADATAPTAPVFTMGVNQTLAQTPTATITTASTDTCSFSGYDYSISRDTNNNGTLDAGEVANTLAWTNIGNVASYQRTGLALTYAVSYYVSIRGRDAAGNVSTRVDSAPWVAQHCPPVGNGVSYYSQIVSAPTMLSDIYAKSTSPGWSLNDYFAVGNVATITTTVRPQADLYALMFSGLLEVKVPNTYTFYTASDEGSDLYINNTRVVANDGLHTSIETSGSIVLPAGCHNLQVRYFENTGADSLTASWQSSTITKATIPSTVLFRRYAPMPLIDWKFNTGSGTVATDASMNGINGTLFGPAWNGSSNCTAAGSNSINFDGSTNEYVQTTSDLTGVDIIQSDFTISFWTRFTAATAGMVLLDMSNGSTPGIVIRTGVAAGSIGVDSSGDVGAGAFSAGTYNNGNWHHVTLIRRGSSLKLYVDNTVQMNLLVGGTATTFNRVTLGRRASGANYFTGDMDQVKIWNEALDNNSPSLAVAELFTYPCR